jgi:hypothetical protein
VPTQAIPLALTASLYPIGIAALLLLLASSRAKTASLAFIVGGAADLITIGILIVLFMEAVGLHQSSQATAHHGLQLGIGIALIVLALLISRRPPRPAGSPSRVSALMNSPRILVILLLGVLLYTPSPAYLTAMQEIGASKIDTGEKVGWVVLCAACVLITVWLPYLCYLVAPRWTVPKLESMNAWLGVHGKQVIVGVLLIFGAYEVAAGLAGVL